MRKFKSDLMIPFNGNRQVGYPPYCGGSERSNFIFTATLVFKCFSRGRSSAKAVFTCGDSEYEMFLKDFGDILENINRGTLTGEFFFVKQGANFGIYCSKPLK